MSKTVKIPDYMKPNYVVTINGVRYSYPAGTVRSVPDCVASAIQHYYDSLPKEDPPETTEQMIRRICAEMIAGTRYEINLTDIALTDEAQVVTDYLPYETAAKLIYENLKTGEFRANLFNVSLTFEYDDELPCTSMYFIDDSGYMHFIVHKFSDGAMTAILDVIIYVDVSKSVYAKVVETSIAGE